MAAVANSTPYSNLFMIIIMMGVLAESGGGHTNARFWVLAELKAQKTAYACCMACFGCAAAGMLDDTSIAFMNMHQSKSWPWIVSGRCVSLTSASFQKKEIHCNSLR